MAEYYLAVTRYAPREKPVFVGPYDKKNEPLVALDEAKLKIDAEFLNSDKEIAKNSAKAVIIEQLTGTEARRKGGTRGFVIVGDDLIKALQGLSFQKVDEIKKKEKEIIEEGDKEKFNKEYEEMLTDAEIEEMEREYEESEAIIVTRYQGNIKWLEEQGIHGPVRERVYPNEVKGKRVVGIVPYRVGVDAEEVGVIDMPNLKQSQFGKELTKEDLDEAGARIEWFKVVRMDNRMRTLFNFLKKPGSWEKLLRFISQSG